MIKLLLSKNLVVSLGIAISLGAAGGAWTTWKFVKASEASHYKKQLEQKDIHHQTALTSLSRLHSEQIAIAKDSGIVKEVIKNVPTDSACRVSDAERVQLNKARGSVPKDPGRPADNRTGFTPGRELPRTAEVAAHADCGLRFRKLKARNNELVTLIRNLGLAAAE